MSKIVWHTIQIGNEMKLTKTDIKMRKACAHQGIADMTVLLEMAQDPAVEMEAIQIYAAYWLERYTELQAEMKELENV